MRKLGAIIMLVLFLTASTVLFSGCKDPLEKQIEDAKSASEAAGKAYDNAKNELDDMLKEYQDYQDTQSSLNNAK